MTPRGLKLRMAPVIVTSGVDEEEAGEEVSLVGETPTLTGVGDSSVTELGDGDEEGDATGDGEATAHALTCMNLIQSEHAKHAQHAVTC